LFKNRNNTWRKAKKKGRCLTSPFEGNTELNKSNLSLIDFLPSGKKTVSVAF